MHKLFLPVKKVLAKFFGTYIQFSFSQVGEDLIIKFIIDSLKLKTISYLDIGANHPYNMNNTYLFYLSGMHGVNIEPNPILYQKIKKTRTRDECLNIGVGINGSKTGLFYMIDNSLLSTFSKKDASDIERKNEGKIMKTLEVNLININDLIKLYFNSCPDLISLDVEGIDFEILNEFDFKTYRPKIFCIETVSYSTNLTGLKNEKIINLMLENGYRVFADTYVNTIFVEKSLLN